MSYSKSNYPVGARWELHKNYKIYYIELVRRTDHIEQWYYGSYYGDHSGHDFDWTTSYQSARNNQWITGRFKRVLTTKHLTR